MTEAGFTGTRKGMTPAQEAVLRQLFVEARWHRLHHGDCVGADEQAHRLALEAGVETELWPGLNARGESPERAFCSGFTELNEPRPYLDRNRKIVRRADVLYATPSGPERKRGSGTWSTVRFARKVGVPVVIVLPDGTVVSRDGETAG